MSWCLLGIVAQDTPEGACEHEDVTYRSHVRCIVKALLPREESLGELLAAISREAKLSLDEFNAQELTNTA